MTTVINVRKVTLKKRGIADFKEWNKRKNTTYIGRNMAFYVPGSFKSKWCNPFSSKKYGLDTCLKMYEVHVRNDKKLMGELEELRNMELGCWCAPDPCHGHVLIRMLDEATDEKEN
jgi:hypothetical protein